MRKVDRRTFWGWGMVGVIALILTALQITGGSNAAPRAIVNPGGHIGGTGQPVCTLDASGYCTVTHNLGYQPAGVVVTSDKEGQLGTTDQITATTFRVRWGWYERINGSNRFAAGTQIAFSWVPGGEVATPPPTTSPPTSATPPPSTTPPTTPSPTPTPTAGPSPVKTCTNGQVFGEQGQAQFGPYYFYLNDWRDSYAGEQYRAMVCSFDNWWLEADVPAHSDLGVEAYPAMQRNFSPAANVATLQSLRFAQNTNATVAGARWNVAVDAWFNSGQSCEVMIWTQWQNQTPAGSNVATVTIGGQQYQVWKAGSTNLSTGACGIVSYRSVNQQLFGSLPVQSFVSDMKARGYLPANNTTWQFNYGVEVVDTRGDGTLGGAGTLRWNFTDHALVTS